MNTRISITSNGNVAPNKVFDFGYKYENVGDTLSFSIPDDYKGYHHYLVFYMKKVNTILLPVNDLVFTVGTTLTRNAGTYNFIFIATENAVVDGDIDGAKKVFVSNTMQGLVKDNDLDDPVTDETLDPNLQIVYDSLLDLKDVLQNHIDTDYYRGAYYIPDLDDLGNLSWSRSDLQDIDIPEVKNITGPRGAFYIPNVDENAVISWKLETDGEKAYELSLESIDLMPNIKTAATNYIDEVLPNIVEKEVESQVPTVVDNKFQWIWDEDTKSLYIYTAADSTSISDKQYNSILSLLRQDGFPAGAVIDSSYNHTDNNYTDADKKELSDLSTKYEDLLKKYEDLLEKINSGHFTPDDTTDFPLKTLDNDGNEVSIVAYDLSDGTSQTVQVVYID